MNDTKQCHGLVTPGTRRVCADASDLPADMWYYICICKAVCVPPFKHIVLEARNLIFNLKLEELPNHETHFGTYNTSLLHPALIHIRIIRVLSATRFWFRGSRNAQLRTCAFVSTLPTQLCCTCSRWACRSCSHNVVASLERWSAAVTLLCAEGHASRTSPKQWTMP